VLLDQDCVNPHISPDAIIIHASKLEILSAPR
jgi:hypothetical protein